MKVKSINLLFLTALGCFLISTALLSADDGTPLEKGIPRKEIHFEITDDKGWTKIREVLGEDPAFDSRAGYFRTVPAGEIIDLSISVDGKSVTSQLLSVTEADQLRIETAKRDAQPSSLYFYGYPAVKTAGVALERGRRFEVAYSQLLTLENALYKYVYPVAGAQAETDSKAPLKITGAIKAENPIAVIYSPTHDISIQREDNNHVSISFEGALGDSNPEFVLYYAPTERDFALHLLTHRRVGERGYFQLFISPNPALRKKMPGEDVVFVLDNSESMVGPKLPLAKQAVVSFLERLVDKDRFNIITSDGTQFQREWASSSDFDTPAATQSKDKDAAIQFMDGVTSKSDTDLYQSLLKALATFDFDTASGFDTASPTQPTATQSKDDSETSFRARQIVLLTDGVVVPTEEQIATLRTQNAGKARINVFGLGYRGASPLLKQLAAENGGILRHIESSDALNQEIAALFDQATSLVLTNVQVETNRLEGVAPLTNRGYNPLKTRGFSLVYPTKIPHLSENSQFILVGRYSEAGKHLITLSGNKFNEPVSYTYEVELPLENPANGFIPRLWSAHRANHLVSAISRDGGNEYYHAMLLRHSRRYGIKHPRLRGFRQIWNPGARELEALRRPFEIVSGAAAIEESLQLDVLNALRRPRVVDAFPDGTKIRNVEDKTFYSTGGVWVDAEYRDGQKSESMDYGSEGYFALLKAKPSFGKFLSIGVNLILCDRDISYFIGPQGQEVSQTLKVGASIEAKTESIDSLKGPEIKSHPYREMLGDSKINIPQVANFIPYDMMFGHFESLNTLLDLSDFLELWDVDALRISDFAHGFRNRSKKLQRQLCLDLPEELRRIADILMTDVSLVINDLFLTDGSDVTLIFHLKNKTVFRGLRNATINTTKLRQPETQINVEEYGGVHIQIVKTPDREISAYSAYLGNYIVISNSPVALKRIIDTQQGRVDSLASRWDYRYMRSILSSEQGAFLYLGDDFVRKMVGPKLRIKRMRRITCKANLTDLNVAAKAYQLENGSVESIGTLLTNGYLRSLPQCPDDGEYQLLADGTVVCSKHGSLRNLTFLSELSIDAITPQEKRQYQEFEERYHDYFRRYFDPIGIEVHLSDEALSLKTCILPLIENSQYNQVRDLAGGKPIVFQTAKGLFPSAIGMVSVKLNVFDDYKPDLSHIADPRIRAEMAHAKASVEREWNWNRKEDIFSWIGNEMSILIGDWAPARDFRNMAQLPTLAVVLGVKDKALAAEFVEKIIQSASRYLSIQPKVTHRGVEIRGIETFIPGYYAITENRLIISTQIDAVKTLIDADIKGDNAIQIPGLSRRSRIEIDQHTSAALAALPETRNISLMANPSISTHMRRYLLELSEKNAQTDCQRNLTRLDSLAQMYQESLGIAPSDFSLPQLQENGYLNQLPSCPDGGEYTYNAQEQATVCNLHGSRRQFTKSKMPPAGSSLFKVLETVKAISTSLQFTEEGVVTILNFILDGSRGNSKN